MPAEAITAEPLPTITIPPAESSPPVVMPSPGEGKPVDYDKLKVNFDDFQKLKGETVEEPPAKVEPINEPKTIPKEEPIKAVEPTPDPSLGKTIHARTGENRDYSGIDPTHVPAFKRMSNEAFELMKPIYKERTELKAAIADKDTKIAELSTKGGSLPESYYSHPDAFILSPEFRQVQSQHDAANYQAQHWKAQLIALKSGKSVSDLNLDAKGNLVVGEPIEVTDENRAELEADILNFLNKANGEASQHYKNLTTYVNNFRYRSEQLQAFVREQEKRFFPQYEDPKYAGWKDTNELIDALPPEFKVNPLTGILGRMFGKIKELQAELVKGKTTLEGQTKLQEEQRLGGPTPASFKGGGTGKPTITYDMFKNL